MPAHPTFSILERIDVGETTVSRGSVRSRSTLSVSSNGSTWVKQSEIVDAIRLPKAFSILERIDVGETWMGAPGVRGCRAFSILERIDVGETLLYLARGD